MCCSEVSANTRSKCAAAHHANKPTSYHSSVLLMLLVLVFFTVYRGTQLNIAESCLIYLLLLCVLYNLPAPPGNSASVVHSNIAWEG